MPHEETQLVDRNLHHQYHWKTNCCSSSPQLLSSPTLTLQPVGVDLHQHSTSSVKLSGAPTVSGDTGAYVSVSS